MRSLIFAVLVCLSISCSHAAPNITWQSVGVGGGGALFSPSISPHDANNLFLSCDMTELFHSTNFGASWTTVNSQQIMGNRWSKVQFTSDPNILFSLDYSLDAYGDAIRPSRSADAGVTWTRLSSDPTGEGAYTMIADPASTQRVLLSDYSQLYFSSNGGTSWAGKYTTADGNGLVVGGAFWDGANIYVGTSDGLLVSSNNGSSFSNSGSSGIAAGQKIVSFCGAKESGTVRLYALTAAAADTYAGVPPEDFYFSHQTVYTVDVGQPSWTAKNTGLPTGGSDGLSLIACAINDIDTAYVSGQSSSEFPMIYKTTNGATNWNSAINVNVNSNVQTGWAGHQGDRQWTYGAGTLGLAVAPNDANRVAFTDLGFCHVTADGGTNWSQAYVNPADENPAGVATPKGKAYRGVGLEDTSNWKLTWLDSSNMWACFSDIQGIRSTDGGVSWSFNYSGYSDNSSYQCIKHPTSGVVYLASGTTHDVYETTHLTDASLDGGDGAIRFSINNGAAWSMLHDFNHIVYDIAFDPTATDRMYAAVISSDSNGGIWVTNNLSAGASSTWNKLTNPPRTEGHPYCIRVLNDGTIVTSFSGRRTSSFTTSSGVFTSTNGGTSWNDRSDANMTYYVKDVVIDPNDATQNKWYACVWSGYGGPPATNNGAGGLYRTLNRGVSWTRIYDIHRVTSCAVSPTNADELFFTTESDGLWYTGNLSAGTPTFEQIAGYPFGTPVHVYYDPFVANKIWVTSFGNGMRTGTISSPSNVTGWIEL